MNATEWEAAWERFVEAEGRYESLRPLLHKPGHVREAKKARGEYCEAKAALRELDPEMCDRLGIEGVPA